jgi:hypothetical protein
VIWLTIQTMIRIGWAVITGMFTIQLAILRAVWSVGWAIILGILRVAWAAIVALAKISWNILVGVISVGLNLLTGRWGAAWAALLTATRNVWNAILGVVRAIWSAIGGVTTATVNSMKAVVSAGWGAIRNTTMTIGTAIQNWVAGLWGRILAGARSAWNAIVNTIANVWGRVREAVRGPVVFVVGIINRLINGINGLITKIGIAKISPIAGFAEGGRVPGGWGGGDRMPIMAEPGEWVLTKRQARGIGYNRLRNLPRYQTGGEVGHPADHIPPSMRLPSLRDLGAGFARITHIDDLWRAGKDLVDDFTGMLTWAASQAFAKLTEPIKKMVAPWATDPQVFPKQWLGKTVVQIIDKAVEFIAGKSMDACGSFAGGNVGGIVGRALQFNGRPYRWGGPANPSQGFDCSSFVSYIAGTSGLPLPGGFRVPSSAHGPVTTDYLRWGGMTSVPLGRAGPGSVAVSPSHIGFIIGPNGSGFAARSTATGIGPQNFARGYTYRIWNGSNASPNGGGGGVTGVCDVMSGPGQGGPENVRRAITQAAGMLGMPWAINAFMAQAKTESNFNARAINNWDSNARAGTPSKGVLQVIDPTFRAYCGPFCSRGIWDILANVYAAMNYAKSRYGARLLSVIGHGHGYAGGGVIGEPVFGLGLRSGTPYSFAERGPELVSPLSGPGPRVNGLGAGRGGTTIHVYPSPGMDERALAAAVSRELAWAAAGGRA